MPAATGRCAVLCCRGSLFSGSVFFRLQRQIHLGAIEAQHGHDHAPAVSLLEPRLNSTQPGLLFVLLLLLIRHGKRRRQRFAIHVAVADDAITVTMQGTRYSVTYRKGDEPWLLASDIQDDRDFPSWKFTFRAPAWTAANDKARELGWIV